MSQLLKGLIDRASYRHYGPNNAINNFNFADRMLIKCDVLDD